MRSLLLETSTISMSWSTVLHSWAILSALQQKWRLWFKSSGIYFPFSSLLEESYIMNDLQTLHLWSKLGVDMILLPLLFASSTETHRKCRQVVYLLIKYFSCRISTPINIAAYRFIRKLCTTAVIFNHDWFALISPMPQKAYSYHQIGSCFCL